MLTPLEIDHLLHDLYQVARLMPDQTCRVCLNDHLTMQAEIQDESVRYQMIFEHEISIPPHWTP